MAVIDELVGILGFDFRGRRDVREYQRSLGEVDRRLDAVGQRAVSIGKLLATAFAAVATGKAVQSAVSFEEAVADINKVVESTPQQLAALETELLKMSRRLPVSAEGLASIAAEAGAAGVQLEDLTGFTEQVALAVVAFDLPAERVGETMAKLGNVFGFTVDEMGKFNDTVNHLSNNMAAKAGEILDFTNRAAGAAKLLGLTADQLAGVGAALIAAGVVPETAARGLNALATRIQTDAKGVDEALRGIGSSTSELQRALAEDGDGALIELFQGLSELDVSEQATALKALVGQDFSDDFSKFLGNPELLAQGFRLANDEAGKLGSAQAEFAARAETTRAKFDRLKGVLTSIGIVAAGPLLDGFKKFADFIFKIVEAFDQVEGSAGKIQAALAAMGFDVSLAKVQEWISVFKAGFDDLTSFIKPIFEGITGFASTAIGEAVTGIQSLLALIDFEKVRASFSEVAGSLTSIFDTMLANATANFQAVKDGITKIFDAIDFSGASEAIGELEVIGNITTAASGAIEVAGEIFRTAVDFISTAIATLVKNLGDFSEGSTFSGFIERISAVFEKLSPIITGLGEIFNDSEVQGILGFLGQLAGELTTLFIELIGNQILTAIEIFISVISTLVEIFRQLADGNFADALITLFGGVGEVIGLIAQSLASIVGSILSVFDRIFGFNLKGVFDNIKEEFQVFLQDTLNFFIDKLNEVIDKLPSFLSSRIGISKLERFDFADKPSSESTGSSLAGGDASVSVIQPSLTDAETEQFFANLDEGLGRLDTVSRSAMPTVDGLSQAAETISRLQESSPGVLERTVTNANRENNVTVNNETTVNQNVTGATAPQAAANAVNDGAQRGTNRGLTVNNLQADD